MSNKTPYEIRLEVLQMAKDYLDKVQEANLAFAQQAFLQSLAVGDAVAEEWKKFIPESYTVEDVMKKAAEFYSFIQKKE
jgi:hypothetical protein